MFIIQFKHKSQGTTKKIVKRDVKSAFTSVSLMKSLGFVVVHFEHKGVFA